MSCSVQLLSLRTEKKKVGLLIDENRKQLENTLDCVDQLSTNSIQTRAHDSARHSGVVDRRRRPQARLAATARCCSRPARLWTRRRQPTSGAQRSSRWWRVRPANAVKTRCQPTRTTRPGCRTHRCARRGAAWRGCWPLRPRAAPALCVVRRPRLTTPPTTLIDARTCRYDATALSTPNSFPNWIEK